MERVTEIKREEESGMLAFIVPLCAVTIALAMDRPIPNPPVSVLRDLSVR